MPRFTLVCTKTGRNWPMGSTGQAYRAARTLGLTDYEIEPAAAVS
jgi:predicted flavoprotein YhiN